MRAPLALLCLSATLLAPHALGSNRERGLSRAERELLAEGAMTEAEMAQLDAQQFESLLQGEAFRLRLSRGQPLPNLAPGVERAFEAEAVSSEQRERLRRDPLCGRKMELFAPNEDQIKEFLLAETQRLMESGQGGSARFIAVNKGIRSDANPEGQTIKIYALNEGEVETIFSADASTGKEVMVTPPGQAARCATTPAGFFRPYKIYRSYVSGTWDSSMPNAVFIYGGIALHATPNDASHQGSLGRRMSGGCVRLQGPEYARAMGFANNSEWDHSLKVRLEVMKSGKGTDMAAGNFTVTNETSTRVRIMNNEVTTQSIDRNGVFGWQPQPRVAAGAPLPAPVPKTERSWGTVVYVHF